MKWEVKLYQGGSVFTEEVYANDYQDAKRTAQARNPTVKIVGVNPIVGERSSWDDDDDDDYSSNQSSSSSSSYSASDSMGMVLLLGALLLIGAIVTYWYIVLPVSLILGILYYIGNKD